MFLTAACALAALAWLAVLAHPRQPHRTRERFEVDAKRDPRARANGGSGGAAGRGLGAARRLGDVTVLIPARNEGAAIERTLEALAHQGPDLEVLVIDDESTDDTAEICARVATLFAAPSTSGLQPHDMRYAFDLGVIPGRPLQAGWGGKLWALEQGLARVERPWTLLLDADIELAPGVVPALLHRAEATGDALVSVMATLRCVTFWERLLVPPFIFFFKLLYPFAAVADPRSGVAGAAGGCMLARTAALREVGAFASLRHALIDDCTLARKLKERGFSVRLSLSRSVRSHRAYPALADFWRMITRTAYTQLRYSVPLLLAATLLMVLVFLVPLATLLATLAALLTAVLLPASPLVTPDAAGLAAGAAGLARDAAGVETGAAVALAGAALLAMAIAYWPVMRFYELPARWMLTLPLAALLFLLMTWGSAVRYWRGTRAVWKNRTYKASG